MLEKEDAEQLPKVVCVSVVHSQQLYDWDCGISCVKMVLKQEERLKFSKELNAILREEDLHSSIWSIDLAFILKRLGMDHAYYTKTMGVDPSYCTEPYYKKAVDVDSNRILRKFEEAEENGIHVINRTLTLTEILAHIAKGKTAIILVDTNHLECTTHLKHKAQNALFKAVSSITKSSFIGHYIVVCGYDLTKRLISYSNPGCSGGICNAPFDVFEKARSSRGTDDDIILIG